MNEYLILVYPNGWQSQQFIKAYLHFSVRFMFWKRNITEGNLFVVWRDARDYGVSPEHSISKCYGIAETFLEIPAIHVWNRIDQDYFDMTWELHTKIGRNYWQIKEFQPYEYYSKIWGNNVEDKIQFHNLLMNEDYDNAQAKKSYDDFQKKI